MIRAEERGWDDELDRVGADTVLLERRGWSLAHVLRADDPGWHVVYEDPVAEVFIRT